VPAGEVEPETVLGWHHRRNPCPSIGALIGCQNRYLLGEHGLEPAR